MEKSDIEKEKNSLRDQLEHAVSLALLFSSLVTQI